jgi:hypothetical protein
MEALVAWRLHTPPRSFAIFSYNSYFYIDFAFQIIYNSAHPRS